MLYVGLLGVKLVCSVYSVVVVRWIVLLWFDCVMCKLWMRKLNVGSEKKYIWVYWRWIVGWSVGNFDDVVKMVYGVIEFVIYEVVSVVLFLLCDWYSGWVDGVGVFVLMGWGGCI